MKKIINQPLIGIIANTTSLNNRFDLVQELGEPHNGFFNSLKFNFQNMIGEIVPLDIQPNSILEKTGFKIARQAMFRAVKYLVDRGAKIICFTASTKRLAGKFGQEVKKMYPEIIFTIGDNSTMISFTALMNYFLSDLDKEKDVVVCLGAGFLGEQAVRTFIKHGFKKIVLLSEQKIDYFPPEVSVIDCLTKLPNNLKFLAGCSHKYEIDPQSFKNLFANSATIVDVCVPPVVNLEVYKALPKEVKRYDAGDFYLSDINYEFKPEILKFPGPHFWYGCFTEAVMLNLAYQDGYSFLNDNFFEINSKNRILLDAYLRREQVLVPLINFFNPKIRSTIPF